MADELGPHRQDDVDRHVVLALPPSSSSFTNATASSRAVGARLRLLEAEQLLELIDDDEHVVVPAAVAPARTASTKPERAAAERGFEQARDSYSPLAGSPPSTSGRSSADGQIADRVAAGTQERDAPARSGLRHVAAVQRGDQPGADERGLAAARRADDAQEARVPQAAEQIVDLLLPAEEQVVLVGLEAAQTRETG